MGRLANLLLLPCRTEQCWRAQKTLNGHQQGSIAWEVFPSQSFIPSMPCVCISALKGLYSRLFPETAVELGISLFCHKPQLKAKTEQAITATESLHQSVPEKNTSGLVYTRATNGFTLMSCWLMLSLGMQSLRWLVSAELALLPNPINHRYLYRETAAVCTQPLFWGCSAQQAIFHMLCWTRPLWYLGAVTALSPCPMNQVFFQFKSLITLKQDAWGHCPESKQGISIAAE